MGVLGASLGLAAVGALAFAQITNRPYSRHPDAVGVGLALMCVWGLSMTSDAFLSPPESKLINPAIDVMLAVGVGASWWRRVEDANGQPRPRDRWKLIILCLLGLQVFSHPLYLANSSMEGAEWWYAAWLNVTFIGQLVCVAWPGGRYVGGHVRDYLRHHSPSHPFQGARK